MNKDTNVDRKSNLLSTQIKKIPTIDGIPMFSLIEFNITELCNRKCSFCPRYDTNLYPNRNEHISVETYENIMRMLKKINYTGNILYSAFGEPLLHNNLYRIIELTKEYCPRCHLEIITNGDFIDLDNIRHLYNSGADTILFSFYDGEHQVEDFKVLKNKLKLTDKQITFRRRFRRDETLYSNRAGLLYTSNEIKNKPCLYPFYQITIDYDGSVLCCPHEWRKRIVVGNTNETNIVNLWNGEEYSKIRKNLIEGNRNFIPCRECDVDGTIMGKEHFELWKDYYEKN
jgi:radical SAM protein with 4Fe4S-binding SPASM domain